MLNQKRIEQSSWFSEQGIPKACFVPVQFFETVGYSYENLQKPDKKGINILKGWVGEVVRGLIRPNKMWMQDVDIVYGVVHERLVDHFIGVEIHLMENTITIFQCGVHKVKENPLIQKLAGKCLCMFNVFFLRILLCSDVLGLFLCCLSAMFLFLYVKIELSLK